MRPPNNGTKILNGLYKVGLQLQSRKHFIYGICKRNPQIDKHGTQGT